MFSYRDAEGTQESKPKVMEINNATVYIRKNIQKKTKTTENGTVSYWSYKEAELTVAEYLKNQVVIANTLEAAETNEQQTDAYAELLIQQTEIAAKQEKQDDAIAEILLNMTATA